MLEFVQSEDNVTVRSQFLQTTLGTLKVTATKHGVAGVDWLNEGENPESALIDNADGADDGAGQRWVAEAIRQLTEYFAGDRTEFHLTVDFHGTEFQKSVWQALARIPYGVTQSYKDIAISIGKPTAVRAVGQANRNNPVAVIVPCHRVIGANGQLVGYAGSRTHLKSGLLALEQKSHLL